MAERIGAAAFVAFIQKRLEAGDGYIYGATGQAPGKLSDWWFSGQYSGRQLDKALYWKKHAERVWDCNGLAEGYYRDQTGVNINTRARNNYSDWCDPKGSGVIPARHRVPGAAVFKKSSYIHHVGFLERPVVSGAPEGDWYIIEARGVMYGVIRSKLSDGGWNHWGLMTKYFDYEGAPQNVPQDAPKDAPLGDRLLKMGSAGEDVRQLQRLLLELGYALARYGADGAFGAETRDALTRLQAALGVAADGEYGEETHAALMAHLEHNEARPDAPEPAARTKLRVTASVAANVRGGPDKSYGIVTVVPRDMILTGVAVAQNGWHCVEVNGRLGWISPKMCAAV